jgi:ABC-type transport system involved in multi-copper enzyme maturation permease subunit
LASGLDENLSLRSHNTVYEGAYFGESQFVHNLLRDILSHLDFVFFINVVGSLLAFTFTYDAISGERQQGTLRLVMANPVRRALLLLSKFLGSYLSFVVSVLPASGAVVLVLYLHPDVGFRASDWEASFWLLVLAMLSVGVYFMLGVFVSCVTPEPRMTLTALMVIWVFLVLVVPNFSPFVAAQFHPIPAFHQVQRQADAMTQEHAGPAHAQQRKFLDAHGGNYEALSEENKMEYQAIWLDHCRTFYAQELTKVWEAFFNQMDTQARLAQYLSLVSPSATFTYLASDLAHTGIESEHAFRLATIRFRRQYAANVGEYVQRTGDKTKLWVIDSKLVPPFGVPRTTISAVVSTHIPQFLVLVLYSVLCFCGAQVAFIRSSI